MLEASEARTLVVDEASVALLDVLLPTITRALRIIVPELPDVAVLAAR